MHHKPPLHLKMKLTWKCILIERFWDEVCHQVTQVLEELEVMRIGSG